MKLWLTIIGMGIITYTIRLSMILLLDKFNISDHFKQALRFVPPAVLSAIIFPELLQPGGSLDVSLGNDRMIAGLLAMIIAWRTKNVLITIAVGMVSLWLLQSL
jgi:branched-subunit amino acid transport protein